MAGLILRLITMKQSKCSAEDEAKETSRSLSAQKKIPLMERMEAEDRGDTLQEGGCKRQRVTLLQQQQKGTGHSGIMRKDSRLW